MEEIKFDTKILKVDPKNVDERTLFEAAQFLRSDEVVAFPTETVYGLGGNALSATAVKKIFTAKGRPSDNPLIVHVSSVGMMEELIEDPKYLEGTAKVLMERFWPGPLTILFPKSSNVPDTVTAHLGFVAIRFPSHPIAKKLIELAGVPIAAPSANISGRPSPTRADHVLEDLRGKIPCVVDGGNCDVGLESTVVDLNRSPPLILRPGGVTLEQLREFVPNIEMYSAEKHGEGIKAKPATPGLKYRHYSPQAKVILVEHSDEEGEWMSRKVEEIIRNEKVEKIGIIRTCTSHLVFDGAKKIEVLQLGDWTKGEESQNAIARGLFGALRELDEKGCQVIVMEGVPEVNRGAAVMNRIRKAAAVIVKKTGEERNQDHL